MINTLSKTLEAQEKTQDIKQSRSAKMGTKSDTRSQRNKLGRGDRTWPYEDRTHLISCSVIVGISSSDRTLSEAVTGRDGRTTDAPRSSVRSCPKRFQSGASMTERIRSSETKLGPESDQRALQRLVGPDTSNRDVISVRSLAESWVLGPTANSHLWGYK